MDEQKEKQNAKKKPLRASDLCHWHRMAAVRRQAEHLPGDSFLRGRVGDRVCDPAHRAARQKDGRAAEGCRAGAAPAEAGGKEA